MEIPLISKNRGTDGNKKVCPQFGTFFTPTAIQGQMVLRTMNCIGDQCAMWHGCAANPDFLAFIMMWSKKPEKKEEKKEGVLND